MGGFRQLGSDLSRLVHSLSHGFNRLPVKLGGTHFQLVPGPKYLLYQPTKNQPCGVLGPRPICICDLSRSLR
jgi:hypothetical protein